MKKLLARAAAPAGAALVSLSAWGAAYAAVAPEHDPTLTEPVLAPQVGNLKTSCSAAPADVAETATPVLPPQVGNLKASCGAPPAVAVVDAGRASR